MLSSTKVYLLIAGLLLLTACKESTHTTKTLASEQSIKSSAILPSQTKTVSHQITHTIEQLRQNTDEARLLKEKYYQEFQCECVGTCGTQQKGRGSECEKREQKFLQSEAEFADIENENNKRIAKLNEELNKELNEELNE